MMLRTTTRTSHSQRLARLKDQYAAVAMALQEDCCAIDPQWLIEHRPALWKRLIWLDSLANTQAHTGISEKEYGLLLDRIIATVRDIRQEEQA